MQKLTNEQTRIELDLRQFRQDVIIQGKSDAVKCQIQKEAVESHFDDNLS